MLHVAHTSQFKSIKQEEHDCSSNTGHKSAQADSREEALQGSAHPRGSPPMPKVTRLLIICSCFKYFTSWAKVLNQSCFFSSFHFSCMCSDAAELIINMHSLQGSTGPPEFSGYHLLAALTDALMFKRRTRRTGPSTAHVPLEQGFSNV